MMQYDMVKTTHARNATSEVVFFPQALVGRDLLWTTTNADRTTTPTFERLGMPRINASMLTFKLSCTR